MSSLRLSALALLVIGLSAGPLRAESYEALSTTAMGITGDIDLDDAGIIFENGETLDFSGRVADEIVVDGVRTPASVYRIAEPANPELNGSNTLCGEDVTYIARWRDGDGETTWIAAFSTRKPPTSTEDLCASFTYSPKS